MAAQSTYTPIATTTYASPGVNYVFSNIPQTYTDLVLVVYGRNTYPTATNAINMYINTTTQSSSNWSQTNLNGTGTGNSASHQTTSTPDYGASTSLPSASATANLFGLAEFHIMNYASTIMTKTVLIRGSYDLNGSGALDLNVANYQSTVAVTSLQIGSGYGYNYAAGTTFTLYGITAA